MIIDTTKLAIGQVDKLVIDGVDYPVTSDGVTITLLSEVASTNKVKPVVGSSAPRKRISDMHFQVDAILAENTLANLQLAWNMPNVVSTGPTYDILYLGLYSSLPLHTLQIVCKGTNRKERRYFFNECYFYQAKPQQMTPSGPAFIPITFYCVADSTQVSGRELGRVEQER